MWVKKTDSSDTQEKEDFFRLLEYHQRAEWNALDKYVRHLNIQAAFMSALIAGGIVALAYPSTVAKFLALSVPLVIVFLRKFTIESLDRSYRRFLEAAASSRKLEWLLHLDQPVSVTREIGEQETPFPKDGYLDVARRWERTDSASPTSASWVADHMGQGRNDVTWRFLRFVLVATLFIPPASYLISAAREGFSKLKTPWLLAMLALAVAVDLLAIATYHVHARNIRKNREVQKDDLDLGTATRKSIDV